jgi:phage shock protein PspC (stress-responsive transcriptional regulator)
MKRLYLSKYDKKIAGVCGGIGETFDIDATFVRLLFAILIFSPLPIVLFYLAAWAIIPRDKGYQSR